MGASESRTEDASLLLATPKFTMVGTRRLLDPSCRQCRVCACSFGLLTKKHYCRRCGHVVCEPCTVMKHYKEKKGHGFRICRLCNVVPPIIYVVSQNVWHLILSFAGTVANHRTIQLCRRTQLLVPLPFHWGASWESFFTEGSFISKGANGSVYKTSLKTQPNKLVAVKVVQKKTIFSLRKWHHIQREIDTLVECCQYS